MRIYSASPTPDVPRLRVTLRAAGWSQEALSPRGPGRGTGSDGVYDTPIESPPRSVLATVCVPRPRTARRSWPRRWRTASGRARGPVDGKAIEPRLGIILLEGPSRSTISRLRTVLDRAAFFQAPIIGWFSLALLLLLVVVAVPGAAAYATLRALRDDENATTRR